MVFTFHTHFVLTHYFGIIIKIWYWVHSPTGYAVVHFRVNQICVCVFQSGKTRIYVNNMYTKIIRIKIVAVRLYTLSSSDVYLLLYQSTQVVYIVSVVRQTRGFKQNGSCGQKRVSFARLARTCRPSAADLGQITARTMRCNSTTVNCMRCCSETINRRQESIVERRARRVPTCCNIRSTRTSRVDSEHVNRHWGCEHKTHAWVHLCPPERGGVAATVAYSSL